jgi:NAD(P)-dependent dehydrogenase (short-subunit alcohol dehydrogenase family)
MGSQARYEDKVCVVTGAASGIGLATTQRLLGEGATVIGGDINPDGLERVATELGGRFSPVVCDVARESDVEELVAAAISAHRKLDAAFNIAGLGDLAPITDMPEEMWDRVMSVTLKGVFLSIKHEARAMRESGGGAIVNVASINCRQPTPGLTAYATAKAGVDMLTRSAAVELGEFGIRVNTLSPGIVITPATSFFTQDMPHAREAYLATIPLGRFGEATDIAGAATFLASDDAAWVSGANLFIDGAESLTGYPSLMKLVGAVPAEVSRAGA